MTDASKRLVLNETVYEQIQQRLVNHDIEPGTKITITALAEELGVSPTPVREALARLESDGLVVKRSLAGYSAAPLLTESQFADLYEMRLLLEPAAAAKAVARVSSDDLAALTAHLDVMRTAGSSADPATLRLFVQHDAHFHHLIAEASGNQLLVDTLRRFRAHAHLYRLYFRDGIAEATCQEHQRIIEALRDHDPDIAAATMRSHLRHSQARLHPAVSGDQPTGDLG